jgi:hypothetical protein
MLVILFANVMAMFQNSAQVIAGGFLLVSTRCARYGDRAAHSVGAKLLLLLLVGGLPVTAAEIALFDGKHHHADALEFIDGDQVQLGTGPDAGATLALADAAWCRLGADIELREQQNFVVLADGSWLPVLRPLSLSDENDHIQVSTLLGDFSWELGTVVGYGPGAWLGQQQFASGSDRLLTSVETLAVTIDGVSADDTSEAGAVLRFQVADLPDMSRLDLALVQGLWLDVPQETPRSGLAWFAHPAWPPMYLRSSSSAGWQSSDGQTASQPPVHGRIIPFGAPRVPLMRLRPSAVEETGAFGVVWPYQAERNLDGSWPLALDGQFAWQSLVIHSEARMSWNLRGRYQRLHAHVGIADYVRPQGDLIFRVLLDGRVLTEERLTGEQDGQVISLDLRGGQELSIVVGMGERFDIGDHLVLGQAVLLR